MSSISSGADFGDVYDAPKPRLPAPPIITTTSPSPARTSLSQSQERRSEDRETEGLSRIGSKDSNSNGFGRGSSADSKKTHRNRFFGRGIGARSRLGTAEEGTDLDDLESGVGAAGGGRDRDYSLSEMMPDIPEASGTTTTTDMTSLPARDGVWREDFGSRTHRGVGSEGRIDPRTGIVSPQAIARDSARERGDLPLSVPLVRRTDTERAMDRDP